VSPSETRTCSLCLAIYEVPAGTWPPHAAARCLGAGSVVLRHARRLRRWVRVLALRWSGELD